MNKILRLHIIIYIIAAMMLPACSSHREVVSANSNIETQQQRPGKRSPILSLLAESYTSWHDVYLPVSLNIKTPVSMGISGRATLVRDSLIHISMRMLGIEVAVAHVTPDSVWLVDKFHHYLCAAPIAAITGPNNLSLSDIQDMLLGRAFYPGRGTFSTNYDAGSLFNVQSDGDLLKAAPRRLPSSHNWYFILNDVPQLQAFCVTISDKAQFSLNYSNLNTTTPAGSAAAKVDATGSFSSLNLHAVVEWNFSKAKWNSNRTENWEVPSSGYKRISASQLISALRAQ